MDNYIVHVCSQLFTGFLFGSHNDDARSLPRNAKLKELCLTI